jgi:Alternative oxidase
MRAQLDCAPRSRAPRWRLCVTPLGRACSYWKLPDGAKMRDLVLAVRADEACHAHVNHTFAGLKSDEPNPFATTAPMRQ